MTEIEYLRVELQYAELKAGAEPSKGLLIAFCDAIKPALEKAWRSTELRGWKTDWIRAARHDFLSEALGRSVYSTKEVPPQALHMIMRWLDGLQPTWTSEDPDGLTQALAQIARQEEIVVLATRGGLDSRVWQRADVYCGEHPNHRYARERVLSLAVT